MNVQNEISKWAKMHFTENPFGNTIPEFILKSEKLLKPPYYKSDPHCLAEVKQDGYATSYITNDKFKTSIAESTDFIVFTEIFHRLKDAETLCPSNFVLTIYNDLKKYEIEHNILLSEDIVFGYITRGMRAFASFIREAQLENIVEQYLIDNNFPFTMYNSTWQTDINEKTDIMFSIGKDTYRIWSYQCTDAGRDKTQRRILRGCSEGYNILLPFDIRNNKINFNGWYLYNPNQINNALNYLFQTKVQTYDNFKNKLEGNADLVKKPQIFFAN